MSSRLIIVGLFGFLVLGNYFVRLRVKTVRLSALLDDMVDLNEFSCYICSLEVTFFVAKFGDLGKRKD